MGRGKQFNIKLQESKGLLFTTKNAQLNGPLCLMSDYEKIELGKLAET